MSDLSYAYEKFSHAAHALATPSASLGECLIRAYGDYLVHVFPLGWTVPQRLADRIEVLRVKMTQRPDPGGLGTIAASVLLMSAEEQEGVRREIEDLALELRDAFKRPRA